MEFSDVAAGNRWCHNLTEPHDFKVFVLGSEVLRRAAARHPISFNCKVEGPD
ncbi:MAG: hypothetical protein ACU85U_14080 [Gammaproteobacteria bacterium]|jgi:hypothetical protein